MPKIKLTKTAVDAATPQERDYELRDTTIPGFLVKVTPAGRKTFMIAYVTNSGQRRKPAIGRYGEITIEQARGIAQDWLAEVRRKGDPSAERTASRQAPTVKELFDRFITDYSEGRNKPSTVKSKRDRAKRHLKLGHLKVTVVTRADIADLMKKMAKSPVARTGCSRCAGRCSTSPRSGGFVRTAPTLAAMSRNIPNAARPASSPMRKCASSSSISIAPTRKDWSIPAWAVYGQLE